MRRLTKGELRQEAAMVIKQSYGIPATSLVEPLSGIPHDVLPVDGAQVPLA
jgi:hypothetical protein